MPRHPGPSTGLPRRLFRLLACTVVLLATTLCAAVEPERRFERIGLDDGLSQASARAVLASHRGFLWFGTQEGLNRYDGYSIKAWQHDPADPQSLSDNNIVALHEDPDGVLWIGTLNGGLNRFDPAEGRFRRYRPDPSDPRAIPHAWVPAIVTDLKGRLWVGTAYGLARLDGDGFVTYRNDPDDPDSLGNDHVRALQVDVQGRLWVGTEGGGLNLLDNDDGRFVRFTHRDGDPASLSHDFVWSIEPADERRLWIGTEGGGVDLFDPATGRFTSLRPADGSGAALGNAPVMRMRRDAGDRLWIATRGGGVGVFDPLQDHVTWLRHQAANPHSLSHNTVWSVTEDRAGMIWIGTADGVNRFAPATRRFGHYRRLDGDPDSLSHNWVRAFLEDSAGRLWIGTQEGLNRWDAAAARFVAYRRGWDEPAGRKSDHVRALAEDPRGGIWVGSDAGLDHFDPEHGEFERLDLRERADAPPALDRITTLFVDHDATLWAGTQESGLVHVDPASGAVRRFRHDPGDPLSLSHNQVRVVHRDARKQLWLGTWGGGLCRLDEAAWQFHCHRHDPAVPTSLSNDVVRAIHEDADGVLWLATQGGGLNRFDPRSGQARAYTRADGLGDDSVYGVLGDRRGRLWLSTNGGLSRFEPGEERFTNYTVRDGLQSSEFNTGAYFASPGGELFFGGIGGFNRFDPEQIVDDVRAPEVVFTELRMFNRPVPLAATGAGGYTLQRPIEFTEALVLSHRDVQFSVEFAALHFLDPRRNRFAYRLDGFDTDWIETDWNNRRATFTNLPAGHYTLLVRASNPQGVWSPQPARLEIDVLPAPWATWWAWLGYALIALLAGHAVLRWRDSRIRRSAAALQALVERRTAELQHSHAELERASQTDLLTGLGNRRHLVQGLAQRAAEAAGVRGRQALLLLDADNFKAINDTYGHAAGDAVLVELGRRITAQCRGRDLAGRWGGEEFLLCLDVDGELGALRCAERLCRAVALQPMTLPDGTTLSITCSIGIACLPFEPTQPGRLDWERVLAVADAALYLAKREGRNRAICLASTGTIDPDFEQRLADIPRHGLGDGFLRVLRLGRTAS